MKIESFWASGFRSLRRVSLVDLGPFNVFYGKNGSGKSNLLAAIGLLIDVLGAQTCLHSKGEPCPKAAQAVRDGGLLVRHDLHARDDSRTIVLGASFTSASTGKRELASGPIRLSNLTVEIKIEWVLENDLKVFTTRLESDGLDLRTSLPSEQGSYLARLLSEVIPASAYTLVGADRSIGDGAELLPGEVNTNAGWHRRGGGLATRLLRAQIDARPAVRKRLDELRSLLEGPPLHRPPFFPVQDTTGRAVLQERLPEPNPDGVEIPIDLAGLGVVQLYVILAQAMLSGARAIAIEEPEAHLHGPTTGLHLRELLQRLVREGHVDQVFLATHSSIFDLDDSGFWNVRFDDGQTTVTKRPLDEIDQHLYEPGPALHAFEELLRMSDPERVMFRRADGTAVSAREMLSLLHASDPIALEYLEDLHRAAVDVVGLRARRKLKERDPR